MREIEELLYRDFAGRRVRDPDAVIFAGLADQRHEERVAPLTAVMEDPGSPPTDRLLACTALTGWGERAGCTMVVAVARRPRSAPWYGSSLDRRYSVDDTFSWLATAVDISDDIADVKGTRGERSTSRSSGARTSASWWPRPSTTGTASPAVGPGPAEGDRRRSVLTSCCEG